MKIHAVLVACALIFASSVASATTVLTLLGTSGGDPDALGVGESVTFHLTFQNPSADAIASLGLSVYDYDEAVADFDSGISVPTYLNLLYSGGTGFGGLANLNSPTLVETSFGGNPNRVQFALSATVGAAITNTGVGLDEGIDGSVGTSQFDITFVGVANGSTTLLIGTGYPGDFVVLAGGINEQSNIVMLPITVPEPGAVAAGAMALASVIGMAGIRRRL